MLTGQILLQLVVILVVVQIFGYLSGRIGQQWVIGEILAGLALGPHCGRAGDGPGSITNLTAAISFDISALMG